MQEKADAHFDIVNGAAYVTEHFATMSNVFIRSKNDGHSE